MNTSTGEIHSSFQEAIAVGVPPRYLIPVRTLTPRQAVTNRALAYEPCPCGSGVKFKFCCYAKEQSETNRRQASRLTLV
jgi:hypothetical protein